MSFSGLSLSSGLVWLLWEEAAAKPYGGRPIMAAPLPSALSDLLGWTVEALFEWSVGRGRLALAFFAAVSACELPKHSNHLHNN